MPTEAVDASVLLQVVTFSPATAETSIKFVVPAHLCFLVQRLLFDPDRGAADGLAVSEVAAQDVLAELGRVDSSAAGRLDAEALLEQPLQNLRTQTLVRRHFTTDQRTCKDVTNLHRVESAVSVEGEADDVGRVLVPPGVHRVTHDISGLREDLLDQDFLPTQSDPLAQVGCDSDHQTLIRANPLGLPLHLPALQLPDHGGQLVEPGLLIKLGELLKGNAAGASGFLSVRCVMRFCRTYCETRRLMGSCCWPEASPHTETPPPQL